MNYVSAVVKTEYLDENTEELIQSELFYLNYDVSNILVLSIKKISWEIPESRASLNINRTRRGRVFYFFPNILRVFDYLIV